MDKELDRARLRASEAVQAIKGQASLVAVYLFGSQIEGGGDEWSDLDIALFINEYDQLGYEAEFQLAHSIRRKLGFDLDLHFFDADYLPEPHPATFAGWVVRNGVRIPMN